jgi:SIR2-like domain
MIVKTLEELGREEIEDFRSGRPAVLVGSAISQFSPTDLPAGGQLASQLLDSLLPWPRWLRKDAQAIPFEGILECYPRQSELQELILSIYGQRTPANLLHKCLADGLGSGIVGAVITTNYDLAMDSHLANHDVAIVRGERDFRAWKLGKARRPVYFKIHGSAEREYADTLVFTLKHEGILTNWKRELLQEILNGRDLIVLGYSGKDFELCPAIASLHARRVYWLQPPNDDGRIRLSANAKKLLIKNGTVLSGTIEKAIPVLLDYPEVALEKKAAVRDVITLFDPGTFEEWRLRVLDRLACASLGKPLARDLSASDPHLRIVRCRMSGHCGDYLQAAREWAKLSGQEDISFATRVEYAIETAGAWFIYGDRRKSEEVLRFAEETLAAIPPDQLRHDDFLRLRGNILRVKLTWLRREAQYAWRSSTLDSIRRMASPLYQEAVECLHGSALDDLCMVQDNAELIGIPLDERLLGASEASYQSLGLRALETVRRRNRIETTPGALPFADRRAMLEALDAVERYGWNHEGWKWNWIYIWRFRLCDLQAWRKFLIHFAATEYPIRVRISRLFGWRIKRTIRTIFGRRRS